MTLLFLTIALGILYCISTAVKKPPVQTNTEISGPTEFSEMLEAKV
jgi:hypothetical protein